ncbi:2-keto-4-pentenoate hydratase/2-oxohepta-3-ene-1,7-dioic acid hydratase (catechol pathway) [Brevibacterium siliguriense]|uniref:2-keto-4-pentenoate hydratase/2-oxohepta-3-ene-1,7-dioic acid hydratase (Catechol pathway) n=1 Tax=Brevibacterium siliguriense TaxID=1136497 RepID=A0A1H1QCK5_9MICO|nr:fumarylacetoacetate hydrolase family protein [Brevibacterium siliguriense]SDS21176.1 2-keto-4-pentenoate hydratase/2-oxohepta-3-ene-1,7-dioic acid hydratase (catechol pathway) [Brevibacterium siliguriense]
MRLANVNGRATLISSDSTLDDAKGIDVEKASEGRFGPEVALLYDDWSAFAGWAESFDVDGGDLTAIASTDLGSPTPCPRQILAAGLNYAEHAAESGFERPDELPPIFTKFVSSVSGPHTTVTLPPGGRTDWEVELGVVIGSEIHNVSEDEAMAAIAGITITQDISERVVQLRGPAPQFSLGKSFPGFLPVGPWLTTGADVGDPNDLEISCDIDGETMQSSTTKSLIFPVGALIAGLAEVITLYPGDLILTGTPDGVGLGRDPQRWIQDGEVLRSRIGHLGELRQTFTAS